MTSISIFFYNLWTWILKNYYLIELLVYYEIQGIHHAYKVEQVNDNLISNIAHIKNMKYVNENEAEILWNESEMKLSRYINI